MNRHCFRRVFNRHRGLLMAVAETAIAAAALGGAVASAQVVPDPAAPGGQRPTVLRAGNGVPLVNIQTPSAAGVSRNIYVSFDVDPAGVILNNSRTETRTQQGGWVQGNPWLAGGTARIILNEVRSGDPSRLGGFVEVAGSRAQVVIANPAGIGCDGCGFINASHATLTTGNPVFNGGSFEGLRVQGGTITFDGRGMEASAADFTDLIARSVRLNAGLWARELRVTAGVADVGVDAARQPSTRSTVQAADPVPVFALDTTHLGGMYANRITLVVTEGGVGVRNAGHIGASVGEVLITASGQLVNTGRVVAAGDLRVEAASVRSSGVMAAGVDNQDRLTQAARLGIDAAGNIRHSGLLASGGDVAIAAQGVLAQAGGRIGAAGDVRLDAKGLEGEGEVAAGRDLDVALQDSFTLTAASRLVAYRDIRLSTAGDFTNEGQLVAPGNLHVEARNLRNASELAAGAVARLDSVTLANTGRIVGGSVVARASQSLHNEGPAALIGASDAGGTLVLLSPRIVNRDQVTATDTAPQATLIGLGDVVLAGGQDPETGLWTAAQSIRNESGLVFAGNDLTVVADTFTNTRRVVQASAAYDDPQPATSGRVTWTSAQPDVPGGRYIEPPRQDRHNSDYLHTDYVAHVARNRIVATSPQAQVQVGGNFTPRVQTLRNHWSAIAAGGSISLEGVTLDQDSWQDATPLGKQTFYSGEYVYRTYRGEIWSLPLVDSGPRIVALGGYDSSLIANQALGGWGNTIHNPAATTGSAPLGGQAGGGSGTLALDGLTLPTGGLYRINTSPEARFLVETHPAFADQQQWQSSDLYFQALGVDAAQVGRRLGDGFHEQQLVRSQLVSLTGRSILVGNDWARQFADMLADGAAFARAVQLAPGATLSAGQAARLTRDVILMETRSVQGQSVLLPVVYLAGAGRTQLLASGALVAANDIVLTGTQGFTSSGTVRAERTLSIDAARIDNRGGQLHSGGTMQLVTQAGGDIDLTSARVSAGSLDLRSGGALVLDSAAQQVTNRTPTGPRSATLLGEAARIDVRQDAHIQVAGDLRQHGGHLAVGGDLQADVGGSWRLGAVETRDTLDVQMAGGHSRSAVIGQATSSVQVGGVTQVRAAQDFVAQGAVLDLQGGGAVSAGRNLVLGAVQARQQVDAASRTGSSGSTTQRDDHAVIGTVATSSQSLALNAGQDLTLQASHVSVDQGRAVLSAGRDLTLGSVDESHTVRSTHQGRSASLLSSRSSAERSEQRQSIAIGSSVAGAQVDLQAGRDVRVRGSDVAASGDLAVAAGRDVVIESATHTQDESASRRSSRSGFFTSGASVTLGTQRQGHEREDHTRTTALSRVGSLEGNVTITAGRRYRQEASDLLSPRGDIAIDAQKVDIVPGQDIAQGRQASYVRQGGITAAVSNPVIAAGQTVQAMARAANRTSNDRVRGLAAAGAALAVAGAVDAVRAGQNPVDARGNPVEGNLADQAGGVNVSLSLGSARQQAHSEAESSTAVRPTLAAGRDVRIVAHGAGADSDLNTSGARIAAGRNLHLEAEDELNLDAARSTSQQQGTQSGNSASIGLSMGLGNAGRGADSAANVSVVASASRSQGQFQGKESIHANTEATAGGRVTTRSGTDTRLAGAVISGQQVVTQVGTSGRGNLVIESLQDTSTYDERSRSAGVSVSIPLQGAGRAAGSVSASRTSIDSDYTSVGQQSAIRAGDGGFQVDVRGDTVLVGGAITSTQAAVDAGRNEFHQDGDLSLRDVANHASYDARSASVQVGANAGLNGQLTPTGTSAGVGREQGEATSVTRAGISGIAGQADARTGDAEMGLRPIFDTNRVRGEVTAQAQVMQVVGREGPRLVADFAQGQARDLRREATAEPDPVRRSDLLAQASSWDEGGMFRIALQGALGAVSGGTSGAIGAVGAAAGAPMLDQVQGAVAAALRNVGVPDFVAQGAGQALAGLTASSVGVATGGSVASGAAALNVEANNRQLHQYEVPLAKDLAGRAHVAGLKRPDGSAYTPQDFEEQLRLMGNLSHGEQPNSIAVMTNTTAIVNSLQQDPTMPRTAQGPAVVEVPGRANSEMQDFIIKNTTNNTAYIPGLSPYTPSNAALNVPIWTTRIIDAPTAVTANGDLAGRSGVGVQQNAPLTQQGRTAIAEGASTLGRQAGVVSGIATAVGSAAPPPIRGIAGSVAAGAGTVSVMADVVHQIADPNVERAALDGVGAAIVEGVRIRLPVAVPFVNEVVETTKDLSPFRKDPQLLNSAEGGRK